MITEQEAQDLMEKFIELRSEVKNSTDTKLIKQFRDHEKLCIQKFSYLITMKTGRYKQFDNYEDLVQEGFIALTKAMANYNPKKGSFFWWSFKYIETRVARCANLHTTIRYPLKVAKATIPHRESVIPVLMEETDCPDKLFDKKEAASLIDNSLVFLGKDKKLAIEYFYGLTGEKPMSINKICKKLDITRAQCSRYIKEALVELKDNIKL